MQDFEAQGIVNSIQKKRFKATSHLLNGEDTVAPVDGAAGESVGGDSRGVQLAGGCKHVVGVCENEKKPGARAGGSYRRDFQVARSHLHNLVFRSHKVEADCCFMESLEKQDLVIRDALKTHHLILLF